MNKTFFITFLILILTQINCFGLSQSDSLKHDIKNFENRIEILELKQLILTDNIQILKNDINKLQIEESKKLENFAKIWIPILIAIITIIFGWRAVVHNKKIKLYELVLDITKEYASDSMLTGIMKLRDWEEKNKKADTNFAAEFGTLRESNYKAIKEIDSARRMISHFFGRIYLLHKNRVIKKEEILNILTVGQIEIMLDLIEPLQNSINPNYNKDLFSFFLDIKTELEKG